MKHTFSGSWITMPAFADVEPIHVFHRQTEIEPELPVPMEQNRHMLFRKTFTVKKGGKVFLYITADDYYKLYIGGKFITQGPAPGFHFHYYYNCIDITPYIQEGENTLAMHVYYQGLINRVWVSGDGRNGLCFDVVQDGEVLAKSDESVKCTLHGGFSDLGMTGYRTQFLERYDSGAPEVGFEKPDFDDSDWENAAFRKHVDYTLVPQPTEQLEIYPVSPVRQEKISGGWRVDFGRMYVGYFSAVAKGKAGDVITLRFGQETEEDGSVRFMLRASCKYEEEWVLSGGTDTLSEYDYKSFRYAEILCPEDCEISDITMIVRHYPFKAVAACKYEEEDLQKIWQLAADSLHYGVQEVIQDCMEREKAQYFADGCMTTPALSVLTGDTSILRKMVKNALETSFVTRGLMVCTPASYMQEMAEHPLLLPGLLLVDTFITKDMSFAAETYDGVRDVLEFYRESFAGEDGLLRDVDKWCVLDWPKEARDGYDFDLVNFSQPAYGLHNAINAYYIGGVKALNRLSEMLGREPFADAVALEKSFMDAFYDKEQGFFRDAEGSTHVSLPGNALPLRFDLCPDKETEERIVQMMLEKDVTASAFTISYTCLVAMARLGKTEEMKKFIAHPDRWLRMLREGGTSTFEAWGKDMKWNTSLFHLTFSHVALFLTDWDMDGFFRTVKA